MKRFYFFILAVFSLCPLSEAATVKQAHTEVELIADVDTVNPGSAFRAGVFFRMDPEWHIYWKNPGDSGMTPAIEWQLPYGVSAAGLEWPVPVKIDLPPLSSYGYEGEVLLAAPFRVLAERHVSETINLKAKVEWLACKVECIPGNAELTLELPAGGTPQPGKNIRLFTETRAKLPLQQTEWQAHAALSGKNILIRIHRPPASQQSFSGLYFFSENSELIQHAAPQGFKKTAQGYELKILMAVTQPQALNRLRGVLVSSEGWRGKNSEKGWEIDIPLEAQFVSGASSLGVMTAVFFAFLGGLILNLMPCVLPVLSLKILGFVHDADENPKRVFTHGLVFTAGVLISFWVLAGTLIILQMAGNQIGWGFQLQSPFFVGVLSVGFFIFALNLFGLFEIGVSLTAAGQSWLSRGGLAGSFASGVLAVLVATPCTAPFMGAALGFALSQPAWIALAVFTALGLGLAAPYLLLCANPRWLKFIPKPGKWMVNLKKFLGVLLLLTSFWLFWVLSIQTGLQQRFFEAVDAGEDKHMNWKPYTEGTLAELREQGKPVFIDFTAAWCLTCQVNERVALERKEIVRSFRKAGITALKADWTNRDQNITRALAAYNRNSIPFYVLYPGNGKAPIILPEILTPAIVKKALQDAGLQNPKD